MKKSVILLIVIFLASTAWVNAQTNKGNYFLAGSSNLSHTLGSWKYKYDGDTEDGEKYARFNLQPAVGYFFINNLVGGLFIDWNYEFYKDPDDDDKYSKNTFSTGPFVRYYFLPQEKFKPFVHGQVGYGAYREKDVWGENEELYKWYLFTHKIGAGLDYFFNDHVAVGAMLGFYHEGWKYKEDEEDESDETYREVYNSFFLQAGVTIVLGSN